MKEFNQFQYQNDYNKKEYAEREKREDRSRRRRVGDEDRGIYQRRD